VPIVVLVILAVLWAVVLVPPLLRARTVRTADSIDDFHHRLDVLHRTQGASPGPAPLPTGPTAAPSTGPSAATLPSARPAPLPATGAAKRRRDVVTVLLGAVAATFLFASATGSTLIWGIQVVADALLMAYVALYAWFRSLHAERDRKVRYLPQRQPELVLRRSASS
jgi:hypothetical protein